MAHTSRVGSRARVAQLLAEADRCVRCGLCLPHCPTYRETREEGESPRGRVALAEALLDGRLALTDALAGHLGRCLACRGCEAACPAEVPYGRLLDGVRAELRQRRPVGWLHRRLQRVVARDFVDQPAWLCTLMRALRAWQGTVLEAPSRRLLAALSPALARILSYLPRLAPPVAWAPRYPARGPVRGEVALFLGCVARELDGETLQAAVRVLARLGYTVHVPTGQGCCGALHLHDGDETEALEMARRNLRAFAQAPGVAIVSVASGCAATLAEYPDLRGLDPDLRPAAVDFSARVREVCDLLARAPWPPGVPLAPLPVRVAVQEPCTARNVLRCAGAAYEVLGRIPGVELVGLPGNDQCCGAGGAYMVTQPAMAERLQARKVEAVAASGAGAVATVNLGCALHLGAGLARVGGGPEVLHPVVLLERQLAASGAAAPVLPGPELADTGSPCAHRTWNGT